MMFISEIHDLYQYTMRYESCMVIFMNIRQDFKLFEASYEVRVNLGRTRSTLFTQKLAQVE